jgi:hypothetical protein
LAELGPEHGVTNTMDMWISANIKRRLICELHSGRQQPANSPAGVLSMQGRAAAHGVQDFLLGLGAVALALVNFL